MIEDVLDYKLWNNRVSEYLIVVGAVVGGIVVLRLVWFLVGWRVAAWAKRTEAPVAGVLVKNTARAALPLIYLAIAYLALRNLAFPANVARIIDVAGKVLLAYLIARFVIAVIVSTIKYYWLKRAEEDGREKTVKALMPIIHIAVWLVAVIFLLDNLGFKVSTVVAGLGIGGVAVALAGQAILKDLFSYFAILFDRPFEIGDFIAVGDQMGTVQRVGVKTTRLKSLGGEELIFSNADLTDSRVQNYKRMERRRVAFSMSVTYQTPAAKLSKVPALVENIIKNVEGALFDRAHFASYGDFGLRYEIVYYVLGNDYNKYMDIQQRINLAIFEELGKQKVEFAYPTRALYLPQAKQIKGKM